MRIILNVLINLFRFNFIRVRDVYPIDTIDDIRVTTNQIYYPDNILCDCGLQVKPTPETIDSSTFDLICSCGSVGYHHPKRVERQQQLSDMLE